MFLSPVADPPAVHDVVEPSEQLSRCLICSWTCRRQVKGGMSTSPAAVSRLWMMTSDARRLPVADARDGRAA